MDWISDARYRFATSCVFCGEKENMAQDIGSAYCYLKEQHLVSQGDCLDGCMCCAKYRPRKGSVL